ncbi:CGNR zinc finger domain-containing protein [Streptomyces sp. NPDC094447]|uniref:CGNR zinc finger domain-containing protein n=1 Tax=unclassified Streptomyces TaxID=2593676 RepID=UPI00382DAF87
MAVTAVSPESEELRILLNSWLIPNDTRQPTETLPQLMRDARGWVDSFPSVAVPGAGERTEFLRLRDDLRADVADRSCARLDGWLTDRPQAVGLASDGSLVFRGRSGCVEELLRLAVRVVAQGRWRRLRMCPDCRWVFFDQSRNNSRTWCSMTAGATGRACGSIAKVQRMRGRRAGQPQTS